MSTPPPDEIEPLVPRLPSTAARTVPDGGEPRTRGRSIDRPRRPDAAPADQHREMIDPLVPDLR